MSSEQLNAFKQFGDRVTRDRNFLQAISTDEREARESASRLGSTQARSERADAALAERTSFADRVSAAYEKGEAISIDIAQDPHNLEMFMRYAQTYGGNSAAAQALLSAELARRSLQPNRTLSDGNSLPTSFSETRSQHEQQRRDVQLSADIDATHRAQLSGVARSAGGTNRPFDAGTAPDSALREEVRSGGERLRNVTASNPHEFDRKAELVRTDDGTLKSTKSLAWQTAKQVGQDAAATGENAMNIVRDLLKPKR